MDRRILGVLFILAFFLWIGAGVWTFAHARGGVETAAYSVVDRHGKFEVRDYPALAVVRTPLDPAATGNAMNGSFQRLYAYLRGENVRAEKIAMTAPILVERSAADGTMSFILPRAVAPDAPAPTGPGVAAATIPAGRYAILRYTGGRDRKSEEAALARLRDRLPRLHWIAEGEPRFAYYDPPWVPFFLRRNEVLLPVHVAPGQ
jgi:hypothetical protein